MVVLDLHEPSVRNRGSIAEHELTWQIGHGVVQSVRVITHDCSSLVPRRVTHLPRREGTAIIARAFRVPAATLAAAAATSLATGLLPSGPSGRRHQAQQ